ncbi:hypothetical protein H310_14896 [Aphanomyces invadans]|uniref:Urease accessory protein UreH-like transmembrane domain-containing protein n=1 Tax=Aphanomyces invadans TaxID=157072 RepID=A0A024TAC8_9STRA|nr:hypothetical protein H310_14896 [Aphanomyces invadans]ETV90297.1 hypothetical protein H310_14896 [Aphanomyces invadans]|eukprot:XP_008881082.1 hypothetical protein H310_14896 [Aphanomyces invadans]
MQPMHAIDQTSSMGKLVATALGFGVFHVMSGPDHLSALATLSAGSSWRSFALGVRWGCGHSIGLIIMAFIFILLDDSLNLEKLDIVTEVVVGVFMIGLGVHGVYNANKKLGDPHQLGHSHGGSGPSSDSHSKPKEQPYEEVPCVCDDSARSSRRRSISDESPAPTLHADPTPEQSPSPSETPTHKKRIVMDEKDPAHVSRPSVELVENDKDTAVDELESSGTTLSSSMVEETDDGSSDDDNAPLGQSRAQKKELRGRWRRCVPQVDMENPTTQKATALLVGIVHGIAGPGGILGVMPAVRYHNWMRSMVYLGTFCATSIVIMGLFAAMYGELTSRLGQRSAVVAYRINVFSAVLSIGVGILWIVLVALGKMKAVFG